MGTCKQYKNTFTTIFILFCNNMIIDFFSPKKQRVVCLCVHHRRETV
uniref:Uncharacterized protein n=1 Tax=Anguilla anguilla TaxID=7936 RepID=A0A0E9VVF5_ANGAN